MASEELDKMWDGWAASLSQSSAKVSELLRADNSAQATLEFKAGFGLTVRKMYTEVASAVPKRFAALDVDAWGAWAMGLYMMMRKAEESLKKGEMDEARRIMDGLREHFCNLHQKAGILKTNDVIFKMNRIAQGKEPSAEALKTAAAELEKAAPSLMAAAKSEDYAKMRAEWDAAAQPILSDGKIDAEELGKLREAAEKFYRGFGYQFE